MRGRDVCAATLQREVGTTLYFKLRQGQVSTMENDDDDDDEKSHGGRLAEQKVLAVSAA